MLYRLNKIDIKEKENYSHWKLYEVKNKNSKLLSKYFGI